MIESFAQAWPLVWRLLSCQLGSTAQGLSQLGRAALEAEQRAELVFISSGISRVELTPAVEKLDLIPGFRSGICSLGLDSDLFDADLLGG